MNINRNNYEEFFLLYVDNEMSAEEKKAVEIFIQKNADLQKELVMLQQTILLPDSVLLDDKNKLLKGVNPVEPQEMLLLYLDNELPVNKMEKLQKKLIADTEIKNEWNILQHTKLKIDTSIIFENKKSLYKK